MTLCGEIPTVARSRGFEPCPKEEGHDGNCIVWSQTQPEGSGRKNGVQVLEVVPQEQGPPWYAFQRVAMLDFQGHVKPEELAVALAVIHA